MGKLNALEFLGVNLNQVITAGLENSVRTDRYPQQFTETEESSFLQVTRQEMGRRKRNDLLGAIQQVGIELKPFKTLTFSPFTAPLPDVKRH